MDLYEHQGKELFARTGISLPEAIVADDARTRPVRPPSELGGRVAVKAQVQIGGRGKGGGIALVAKSPDEAARRPQRMLGEASRARRSPGCWSSSWSTSRGSSTRRSRSTAASGEYLAMVSAEGGMDIEDVARERPGCDPARADRPDARAARLQVRWLAGHLPPEARDGRAATSCASCTTCSARRDATLVEINPLVLLADGRVVALDAKVTIDDNALFRQPELAALGVAVPGRPDQARANEKGLQYVKLDGDVGIIGNGAGLVMSTLDVVSAGGRQAGELPRRGRRGQRGDRWPPRSRWSCPTRRCGRS